MRLRAATQLQPLAQGELDGLCGLYAVINAVRLALHAHAPLDTRHVQRLFRAGTRWLAEHELLDDAIYPGLGQGNWQRMAAAVVASASGCRAPLALKPLIRDNGRDAATAYSNIEAAISQQRPVLALLHEQYHHYTVISGIGASRLTLFDSYGYGWLLRRSISFRRVPSLTRHRIAPRVLLALHVLDRA